MLSFNENSLRILKNERKRNPSYTVFYLDIVIGSIVRYPDFWIASASIEYGLFQRKVKNRQQASEWLLSNYCRIVNARIKSQITASNYIIECDLISIEIKQFDIETWLASIDLENKLDFEYFPDRESAILYSFDLILDRSSSAINNETLEF